MTTIAVIIPSLNSPLIDRVVACVQQQTHPPDEIIVVGRDEAGKLAHCPDITFVDTHTPISAAAARNQGAAHASSEVLCFIDADCLADREWLAHLVAAHQRGVEVVGGAIRSPEDCYWVLCDNLAALSGSFACSAAGERPFLPSLNLSIPRAIFEEVQGFDEMFQKANGEDADLSFRLRRRGYHLHFAPDAVVTHYSARCTLWAVWMHLYAFGAVYPVLQEQHGDLMGSAVRRDLRRRWPLLLLCLSPVLALWDSLLFYRTHPCLLQYWHALPGVVWGRMAWYVGQVWPLWRNT